MTQEELYRKAVERRVSNAKAKRTAWLDRHSGYILALRHCGWSWDYIAHLLREQGIRSPVRKNGWLTGTTLRALLALRTGEKLPKSSKDVFHPKEVRVRLSFLSRDLMV